MPETPRNYLWRPERITLDFVGQQLRCHTEGMFLTLFFQESTWFYGQVKQVIYQSINSKASQSIATFIIRLGKPAMVLNSLKYAEFN